MTTSPPDLSLQALQRVLDVTQKLAAPFDLLTMLREVVEAGESVLDAENGSVWLYDAESDELVLRVARDMEPIRVAAGHGIVGQCLQERHIINVPDCYSDPRFNPEVDRASGYRTRCMLALPLISHDGSRVGVMQILNKRTGTFDSSDEAVATALAAQCAVALQRVQMTEALVASERLEREIAVAHDIQMGTLPRAMPSVPGYDLAGAFHPADECGGDTFDLVPLDAERLFILLGDATGHGIGPALSATQVRAMLRVALRLGAMLDDAFRHINDQLTADLPDDRFVTAFLGVLDAARHEVSFHAGGQGPILHYRAAADELDWHPASTFAMGVMEQAGLGEAQRIEMAPGDVLAVITDGVYEYEAPSGAQFGQEGVGRVIREHATKPMAELVENLVAEAQAFAGGAAPDDDITVVVLRRLP